MAKPISPKESHLRRRFNCPHDIWYNGTEGKQIARKRWKRNRSKLIRQVGKQEIRDAGS